MKYAGPITFSYTQLTKHIQELGLVLKSSDGFYTNLSLPIERIPNAFLG